jgi:hypothetical protein
MATGESGGGAGSGGSSRRRCNGRVEQFALDPAVAPARILPRHPLHQCGDNRVDRRAAGLARVGPLLAHQAAVPAQDRARSDQAIATQGTGQPPDQGGEDSPVGPVQAWCRVRSTKHGDLMTQHQQLDVLGGRGPPQQHDKAEHLQEDQIQQPQRHGGDHAQLLETAGQRHFPVLAPHRLGYSFSARDGRSGRPSTIHSQSAG